MDSTSNAKNSYEILEAGENSKFKDELEYLLDGLECSQTISVRRTRQDNSSTWILL